MSNCKKPTYLFDFDGTLVDSMPTFAAVMLRILGEYGIEYDEDIIRTITPLGYHGTAEYFCKLGVPSEPSTLTSLMMEYARGEYEARVPAKEGVIEALSALYSLGASLNILTASPHAMLDPCLKRLGIFDLFDNVWSTDDFGMTKSDPDIFRSAAEKLGGSTESVRFVDDNATALLTAKTAGMRVYGIFDPTSEDSKEYIKSFADGYLMLLGELLPTATEE